MQISHFTAVLIFATCVSVVFGITQRQETRAMVRYGLVCFTGLVALVIATSWVLFFIKR